jgi:hypothetical protein
MGSLGIVLCSLVTYGLPIYLVLRVRGWRGVVVGALTCYACGWVSYELRFANDPESVGIGYGMWIFVGWAAALVYCLRIPGVQAIVTARRS